MIQPGAMIAQRYEIEEKIGSGGMSIVYKAKDIKLGRQVAVKILRDEFCYDDDFVAKFKVEAQAAASLSHINIVNIYDVGNDDMTYYIVMELLKGITLKEHIKSKGQLSNEETMRIGACIASALECAHTNHIFHRDIKPQNIIIDSAGRIKVADFGIARIATGATIPAADRASGSVHYMPPEQAKSGYSNEKSDLYSLGITMFEMITGQVPFKADSAVAVALKQIHEILPEIKDLNEEADQNLIRIIRKATQKRGIHRYKSAEYMLDDLKRATNFPKEAFVTTGGFDDYAQTMVSGDTSSRQIWSEQEVLEDEKPLLNKLVVGGAVLSAVIVVALIALIVFSKFGEKIMPVKITVPSVVGMSIGEVEHVLTPLSLTYKVKEKIYSDSIKKGTIIEQNPAKGTLVDKSTMIQLILSQGQELYTIPNLNNTKYDVAEKLVEDAHLTPIMEQAHNDTVPVGVVFDQVPEEGTAVPEGTEITFKVSIGKEEKYVVVPDVSRKSLDEAINSLKAIGLKVGEGVTKAYNDVVEKGHVIAMTVSPGTKVREGYEVDLTISLGKEIKPITKTIEINNILDVNETSAILKVIFIQEGKEEVIYDGIVTQEDFDSPVVIHITKMGRGTYEVYKDNDLEYTYELIFTQEIN